MRSLSLLGLMGLVSLVSLATVAAFSPWTMRAPEPGERARDDGHRAPDVAWWTRVPRPPLCRRLAREDRCRGPATQAQAQAQAQAQTQALSQGQHVKHIDKARRRMQRSVLCSLAAVLQRRSAEVTVAPAYVRDRSI